MGQVRYKQIKHLTHIKIITKRMDMSKTKFVFSITTGVAIALYLLCWTLTARAEDLLKDEVTQIQRIYTLHDFHPGMQEEKARRLCLEMKPSYSWFQDTTRGFHLSACVTNRVESIKAKTPPRFLTRKPIFILFDVHANKLRNIQFVYFEPQQWLAQKTRMQKNFSNGIDMYTSSNIAVDSPADVYYNTIGNNYLQAYVLEPQVGGLAYTFDRFHTFIIRERLYVVEFGKDNKNVQRKKDKERVQNR